MSNQTDIREPIGQTDGALGCTAVLLQVDNPTHRYVLRPPRVVIGRGVSYEHDIAIAAHDSKASRRHARLTFDAGVWILEDTSLNGTKVNGNKLLNQTVVLSDSDYIQIGKTFQFIFRNMEMTDLSDSKTGEFDNAISDVFSSGSGADQDNFVGEDDEFEMAPSLGLFVSSRGYVYRDGNLLSQRLTRSEHRLLEFLIPLKGRIGSFELISNAVWGVPSNEPQVLQLVRQLWLKIELNPSLPRYLFVQSGVGVALLTVGL